MDTAWDSELAQFLTDLTAVQEETLRVLMRKRELLAKVDMEGLAMLAADEQNVIARLQECLQRREQLLAHAAEEGLPADRLQSVADALPSKQRQHLKGQFTSAGAKTRLLQHHSMANLLVVQKSLIHLGQLLQIIATGGRLQPTYGNGEPVGNTGSLVDRAA
jgi:hypothetical protein